MVAGGTALIADLEARGLIAQMTGDGELAEHLSTVVVRSIAALIPPQIASI